MSAFYLNELLLKLTHRDDPHEGLFEAYDVAITELRRICRAGTGDRPLVPLGGTSGPSPVASEPTTTRGLESALRRFELRMLQELGYAVELAREAASGEPIDARRDYWYVVERGPVRAEGEGAPPNAVRLRGITLIDLERGRFEDAATVAQAKQLMRLLINHSLNGQELATRALVRDLQSLAPGPSPRAEESDG
jgi:DNA repair protein RecO (recombination protein O)